MGATCEHEHGGGFAGAVVAEERRDFALVQVQIQLVHRRSGLPRKYLQRHRAIPLKHDSLTRYDTIRYEMLF